MRGRGQGERACWPSCITDTPPSFSIGDLFLSHSLSLSFSLTHSPSLSPPFFPPVFILCYRHTGPEEKKLSSMNVAEFFSLSLSILSHSYTGLCIQTHIIRSSLSPLFLFAPSFSRPSVELSQVREEQEKREFDPLWNAAASLTIRLL